MLAKNVQSGFYLHWEEEEEENGINTYLSHSFFILSSLLHFHLHFITVWISFPFLVPRLFYCIFRCIWNWYPKWYGWDCIKSKDYEWIPYIFEHILVDTETYSQINKDPYLRGIESEKNWTLEFPSLDKLKAKNESQLKGQSLLWTNHLTRIFNWKIE